MISRHPNGSFFLFHIGSGTPVKALTNCSGSADPFLPFPAGQPEPPPATTHVAESLQGPWRPAPGVPGVNNPAAYFFQNGTTLLFDRTSVRWASAVDGKYDGHRTTVAKNGTMNPEDPGVYRDKRGGFHMLFNANSGHSHCKSGVPCGGHAWSRDGLSWSAPLIPAFGTVVHYADGSSRTFDFVERPQIAQEDDGTPLTLFLGQSYADSHTLAIMFCQEGDEDCVTTTGSAPEKKGPVAPPEDAASAPAPPTRCTVYPGLTIGTQNLGTVDNVKDAGHCCDLCTADGRCAAWTWHAPPTSTCWLKDDTVDSGRPRDKHNHTCSGLRIGPLPSPPSGLACLPPHDAYPFCDTTLAVEARVADLVKRINDSDKPNLLTARGTGGSGKYVQAIPALGVPGYYCGLGADRTFPRCASALLACAWAERPIRGACRGHQLLAFSQRRRLRDGQPQPHALPDQLPGRPRVRRRLRPAAGAGDGAAGGRRASRHVRAARGRQPELP